MHESSARYSTAGTGLRDEVLGGLAQRAPAPGDDREGHARQNEDPGNCGVARQGRTRPGQQALSLGHSPAARSTNTAGPTATAGTTRAAGATATTSAATHFTHK